MSPAISPSSLCPVTIDTTEDRAHLVTRYLISPASTKGGAHPITLPHYHSITEGQGSARLRDDDAGEGVPRVEEGHRLDEQVPERWIDRALAPQCRNAMRVTSIIEEPRHIEKCYRRVVSIMRYLIIVRNTTTVVSS